MAERREAGRMVEAATLARADWAWEIRELRCYGASWAPEITRHFMTWESQPQQKRDARIAQWAEILADVGTRALTGDTLAKAARAWDVRRVDAHSPGLGVLVAWEANSQASRDAQVAKCERILAGIEAGIEASGVFDEE